MGYYRGGDCMYGRGDYYRGDYYRGDPGIFSGIAKAIGGAVKGFVTGGPLGAVAGAARAVIKPAMGTALAPAPRPPVLVGEQPFQPGFGVQTPGFRFGMFGPGPLPEEYPGGVPPVSVTPGGQVVPCQLKGYHPNKSAYFRQTGPGSSAGIRIPKGSICVKSRRMNPANGRALRRALRRAYAFKAIAMRTVRLLNPTQKKRFGGFKKGRKSRA